MIVVEEVLGRTEVQVLREALEAARFADGRATAGAAAMSVKHNEQARGDDPAVIAAGRRVRLALEGAPVMRRLVRPIRWSSLIFSRYGPGQQYGLHADNAGMYAADGEPLRTDVSFTVFLSDPETYEGGDLFIEDRAGGRMFRPPAGSAVLYPTGLLHRVMPVTAGERLACVGWVQCLVRRPDQREILFDLEGLRDEATGDASLILDKTIGNLLRMWGEG